MVLRVNASKLSDVMPQVYYWWDQLKVDHVDSLQDGAFHVVVCNSKKDKGFDIDAPKLGKDLISKLNDAAALVGWKGEKGTHILTVDNKVFVLVVRPQIKTTNPQIEREIGIEVSTCIKSREPKEIVFCATGDSLNLLNIMEGVSEGLYKLSTFKGDFKAGHDQNLPDKLSIFGETYSPEMINETQHRSQAAAFTKMLQDAPSNWLHPEKFSELAKELGDKYGFKVQIDGRKELEALNMGSFLSVGQGSCWEPQRIVIEIDGEDNSRTKVLIGKGLTFDAGGVSIKPSAGMWDMKYDMSGGAAVLGAARFFGGVKPKTKVICIIGAVENVISEEATNPGDVATACNGKTIEILNTDAEGRLVLADLLAHATKTYKPELTVNIATLTGAVLVSLGSAGSAVITNDESVTKLVKAVSEKIGEPFWELPIWPELEKEVRSEIADYKNIANANVRAGTIVAGVFLKNFVEEGCKWAHLDIAGTGWNCSATGFAKKGGSGYGLRTLTELCMDRL